MVESKPIDSLFPDSSNPRKADVARLGLLRLSLAKMGFISPIYVTASGMILSGHQRHRVAKDLGVKTVPVVVVDVKEKDIKGINLVFNRRLATTEPVATPYGWKAIGDICVGEEVIGGDGLPHRVTSKTDEDSRTMYKVVLDDGTEILADAEHLWSVEYTDRSQTTYKNRATVETLRIADMLRHENRRVVLPVVPAIELPEATLPIDPWVVGALLGDGSLGEYGVRLYTSAPLAWVIGNLQRRLPDGSKVEYAEEPGSSTARISLGGGRRGGVMHNAVLDHLRELGLDGTTATDKFVPDMYLWGSIAQRLDLLRGLMDSDGSAAGVTPVYTTVSEMLADNVVQLVFSLGGKATKRTMREAVGTWSKAYQVTVRMPEGVCPFSRPDRVARFSWAASRLRRRITRVEEAGVLPSVCISVDSEDHLYLARNYVPTHNSTNDLNAFDTGGKINSRMNIETIIEEAESLPDFEGEDWPALHCKNRPLSRIKLDASMYDKKAVNLAGTVMGMGIKIPAVIAKSGKVVNGVYRLFAALEAGEKVWPVIEIPDDVAGVARDFLNYLSMDFAVDEDFARLLRYSAYRRPQNNRGNVPKAYRFWANGGRTLLDRDSYSASYWQNFRDIHGDSLLDYGAGLCKVKPFLEERGLRCAEYEPYRIDPSLDNGVPSPDFSKHMTRVFLDEIATGVKFTSIFMASVLNSIPFAKDRMVALAIVHALCDKDTAVYGTCRDMSDFNYEYGGIRNANYFVFDSEPGVRLGDYTRNPKIQKFETTETADAMFKRLWAKREFNPGGNVFYFKLSAPMNINPKVLGQAIDHHFENLPYSDGTVLGMGKEAKEAFSKRLGVKIP